MGAGLRVAALELPAAWGDVEGALARVERLLAAAPCDLALLPEASLTGYVSPFGDFDPTAMAEPLGGPTHARLAELARAHRTFLAAPLIERAGARFYNAFVVLDREGETVGHYRKRHPWIPETWATRGDLPYPELDIDGLRATLAVCYDVHFVAREAAALLGQVDLLLFPSAWVEEEDSRPQRLPALARRFGVTVANANWGPGQPQVWGQGSSAIYDSQGNEIHHEIRDERVDAEVAPRTLFG